MLLALDGLHFVQSRVAMLDVFLAAWVLGAFACLVADRDDVRRRLAVAADADLAGWGPRLGLRPWRLAAGVCLGAAVATKWSGLYYVAVLVLLAFAWEVGARRTAGVRSPVRATVLRSAAPSLLALLVLPAAVYVASWAGWFLADGPGSTAWDRQWAATNPAGGLAGVVPDGLRSWWHYHVAQFRFHDELRAGHPYSSHPAGWLLLARPVSYYYPQGVGPGDYGCEVASCSREVLAIGTPAIWWAAIPVLLALLWLWVSQARLARGRGARDGAHGDRAVGPRRPRRPHDVPVLRAAGRPVLLPRPGAGRRLGDRGARCLAGAADHRRARRRARTSRWWS